MSRNVFFIVCAFAVFFVIIAFLFFEFQRRRASDLSPIPTLRPFVAYSPAPVQNITNNVPTPIPPFMTTPLPSATPQVTATPRPTSSPGTSVSVSRVTYVPIWGSFETTNTEWTDVPKSEFIVDGADYDSNITASFEASLSIANANGRAYARLVDVTHGIVLESSEISTTNSAYTLVVSSSFKLWAGRNTYKVQIKSQTSQLAGFGGGRLKILQK